MHQGELLDLLINPSTPLEITHKVKTLLCDREVGFMEGVHYEPCYSYLASSNPQFVNLLEGLAREIGLTPVRYGYIMDWKPRTVPKNELSSFPFRKNMLYLSTPFFIDPDDNY